MKKIIPINDNWQFSPCFSNEYFDADFDVSEFETVCLPHTIVPIARTYFDETELRQVTAYFRKIRIPSSFSGSKIMLKFDGILSYSEVYVNGIFVASHKGETPFEADITFSVRFDSDNLIAIKVDSNVRKDVPSCGLNGPMLNYGGIYRGVNLCILKGETIADVYVNFESVLDVEKAMRVEVRLSDFYPDTTLKLSVLDSNGSAVGTLPDKTVLRHTTAIKGFLRDVELWSCENPVIYTLEVMLVRGEKILDTERVNFGIREAKFTRNGFYLNGQKTKLIGLNRFDSFTYFGRSAPSNLQREDVRILRQELCCNVVRTHSLMHKDFVEECDRQGLMIITDISGDGYLGKNEWRDCLINTVAETVMRDRNNPSIIAWGVRVNNSADFDELYFKTNKEAHSLDPSRQTIGARSFMSSRLYEDVFAFNDYSRRKGKLSRRKSYGRLFVPYIVSEHTGRSYPVKPYDNENVKTTQALQHLYVMDKAIRSDKLCGAIGMSFADFHSATHKGSGNNVNHYGVLGLDRDFKSAGYAYASQFSKKPIMHLSSNLAPDELRDKLYIFTNCDFVKFYRNGTFVKTFYPFKKGFKNLPHPPICVKVTELCTPVDEGFKSGTKKVFNYLMKKAIQRGGILALREYDKLIFKLLALRLKLDSEELRSLFTKYSLDPLFSAEYTFEGYINDSAVIKKTISGNRQKELELCVQDKIVANKSFEATRVTVKVNDGNGNILDYLFAPIFVSVEGVARLVSDESLVLKAGRCSFYIVTNGSSGAVNIKVRCLNMEKTISTEVIYERMEQL